MSLAVKSLTPSLIASCVRGGYAKAQESEDAGISLHRMPPAMEAFYDRTDHERVRKVCTAGVRLAFQSDTHLIRARLHFGKPCRKIYTIDTVVDGEVHTVDALKAADEDGWVTLWESSVEIPREAQNFRIWLSPYVETRILEFAIEEDASFAPTVPNQLRWLALGDSITQGMLGSSPTRTWAVSVARELGLDITNFGVGGAIMESELADFIAGSACDFLTIAYGTNDCNKSRPLEEYQDAYRDFFSRLRLSEESKPSILVIGPPPWINAPKNALGLTIDDYQQALEKVCVEIPGVQYVNGFSLIPANKKYFPDDVHPNDSGMEAFAKKITAYFR